MRSEQEVRDQLAQVKEARDEAFSVGKLAHGVQLEHSAKALRWVLEDTEGDDGGS